MGSFPSTSTSLILRVQQGDSGSWQEFAGLYVGLVYHWLKQAGLQPSDAQDVCQEVFLKVLKSINSFHVNESGDSLRGWLLTITRHAQIDWSRRHQRQVPPLSDGQLGQLPAESFSTGSQAPSEYSLLVQAASEIVKARVAPKTWQMFEQLVIHETPIQEIAAANGVSLGAVYKAKMRVMAQFRELLPDKFAT